MCASHDQNLPTLVFELGSIVACSFVLPAPGRKDCGLDETRSVSSLTRARLDPCAWACVRQVDASCALMMKGSPPSPLFAGLCFQAARHMSSTVTASWCARSMVRGRYCLAPVRRRRHAGLALLTRRRPMEVILRAYNAASACPCRCAEHKPARDRGAASPKAVSRSPAARTALAKHS